MFKIKINSLLSLLPLVAPLVHLKKIVTSFPKELAQADPLHDFKAKQ